MTNEDDKRIMNDQRRMIDTMNENPDENISFLHIYSTTSGK